MSANKIVVDPMTRIEGHLRFETRLEDGVVTDAHCSGDMFRGIEKALIGHDARVAQQVTQRVCGVCPYAHAEAAATALEDAMGIKPPPNGQRLRNLTIGAYHLQDYLLHFYTLCALDFVDITAILDYKGSDRALIGLRDWVVSELNSSKVFPAAPFLPRYQAVYLANPEANISAIRNYLDSIKVMAELHKAVALFGGKAPHPVTIEAGGMATRLTIEGISQYRAILDAAEPFIKEHFFNDVVAVAGEFPGYFAEGTGYGNLLSYPHLPTADGSSHRFAGGASIGGKYEKLDVAKITEDHLHSYYKSSPDRGVKPLESSVLTPISYEEYEARKPGGKYSWTKAPRYGGNVMEVGPAARVVNTYRAGVNPALNALVDKLNGALGVTIDQYHSVLGRHLARYIMAHLTVDILREELEALELGQPIFNEQPVPKSARGMGLVEATRGALGHWIETDDRGYIKNYDMIVPTTWNMSPRDAKDRPGAVEKMLMGTRVADATNPMELARIIRSTDPCMACSVH